MANFVPKFSTDATVALNTNIVPGQFIITTDGHKLYVDIAENNRIEIGGSSSDNPPVSKYTTTIGNGSTKTFTITHNLGTQDIIVSGIALASNSNIWLEYTITNDNSISITFDAAPASNSIKIIIIG